jgi:hypothetical protein
MGKQWSVDALPRKNVVRPDGALPLLDARAGEPRSEMTEAHLDAFFDGALSDLSSQGRAAFPAVADQADPANLWAMIRAKAARLWSVMRGDDDDDDFRDYMRAA